MDNPEIIKMSNVIQNFLEKEKLINAKSKDLMPILIEKGFFIRDNRVGKPLRDVLRELDSTNELSLIPQVRADRKMQNVMWFFNAIKI